MVISDNRELNIFLHSDSTLKICKWKKKIYLETEKRPNKKNQNKSQTHKKALKGKTTEVFKKVANFIYISKDSGEDVISATSF